MTWLVVHTRPRQEAVAAENLGRQGFEVFYPRLRQRKRVGTRWEWVTGPLFPRYLFINVDIGNQGTAAIRSTRGVLELVRVGNAPAVVPAEVVGYLISRQDPELAAENDDSWPHKPGDRVEIASGPFAGFSGIYRVADGAQRVTLLVEILGRKTGVVVARDDLGDVL